MINQLEQFRLPFFIGLLLTTITILLFTAQPALAQTNACFASLNNSNTTDFQSSDGSALQAAVDAASPGDLVKVAGTCTGAQLRMGLTQTVFITKSLTLRGGYTTTNWLTPDPTTHLTTLDAQRAGRAVVLSGTIDITLNGLILTKGLAFDPDTLDNGGGIWNNGAALTITHSSIISNLIAGCCGRGGGINVESGSLYLADSMIAENEVRDGEGGALSLHSITATIIRTTFENNRTTSSADNGGAILIRNAPAVQIIASQFLNNYTLGKSANAGAIYITSDSVVTIANSTLSGNKTFGRFANGGAINHSSSSLTIQNSLFQNNHTYNSSANGGAIYNSGLMTITNSNILSNSTTKASGGGLWSSNNSDDRLTLQNSTVAYNQSLDPTQPGGGLAINPFSSGNGQVVMENVTFSGNSSTSEGGAMWVPKGSVTMTHVTISSNSALTSTGGISVGIEGTVSISNSIIANNSGGDCATVGTFTDGGYNLIEDGGCLTASTSFSGTANLAALADNGGPATSSGGATLTHALLNNSPALDRIPSGVNGCGTTFTTDQRQFTRPFNNGACDIGAFEVGTTLYLPILFKN
ncbi:MAG: choice-of-anchor Q domain-containing protein [Chloroflexota bacterium]